MSEGAPLDQAAVRAVLATKTVGLIGLGGLGSNVAMMLVRSGVRRFVLADFDQVEVSNLNRQLYFTDQLGHPKTDSLTETLTRIEPGVGLDLVTERVTPDNLVTHFGHVDVLVEAVDTAEDKSAIVRAATELLPDTPLVWAMGLAGYASANDIGTSRASENSWIVGDLESDVRSGLPLLASRVMVAAAHEAHMTVRLLLGIREA